VVYIFLSTIVLTTMTSLQNIVLDLRTCHSWLLLWIELSVLSTTIALHQGTKISNQSFDKTDEHPLDLTTTNLWNNQCVQGSTIRLCLF